MAAIVQTKVGPATPVVGTVAITTTLDTTPVAGNKVIVEYRYAKEMAAPAVTDWTLAVNDEILNAPSAAIYFRDVTIGTEAACKSFTMPAVGQGNHNIVQVQEVSGLATGLPSQAKESSTTVGTSKTVGPTTALTLGGYAAALWSMNGDNGGATGSPTSGWTRSSSADPRSIGQYRLTTANSTQSSTEQWTTSRQNVAVMAVWQDSAPPPTSNGLTTYLIQGSTFTPATWRIITDLRLLLESGDFLLLETGYPLLTES